MPCSTPVMSKLNQRVPRPFLQWPVTLPFEMLPMRVALSVLLLASALSACTPAPVSTANSAEAPAPASAIAWRQGDVDDAFAEAADSGKPVLLYWGAVWCPPCNQLKAGLFKDPAFIALTSKFVPVYLDGDEEGAQAWGERFGVRGYPTLIVLDPQRNEITRVAGGNDAAELTRALTVAAGRRSAVAATLATALATPDRLAAEDWQVLGDYGWEVDANRLAGERKSQDVLRQLSKAAPDAALQRRFALLALATAEKPDASPTEVRELLQAVLAQPAEVRRNRELLGYAGVQLVKQASAGPATSNTLGQQLLVALERADAERGDRADDALSRALTEVSLARQQQPKGALPAALVERVKQRVAAADAAATDAHARQATISSAAYALRQVGDDAGAEALLLAEQRAAVLLHARASRAGRTARRYRRCTGVVEARLRRCTGPGHPRAVGRAVRGRVAEAGTGRRTTHRAGHRVADRRTGSTAVGLPPAHPPALREPGRAVEDVERQAPGCGDAGAAAAADAAGVRGTG